MGTLEGREELTWFTSSQARSRRARLGWAANHHRPHVAESIV